MGQRPDGINADVGDGSLGVKLGRTGLVGWASRRKRVVYLLTSQRIAPFRVETHDQKQKLPTRKRGDPRHWWPGLGG